MILSKYVKRFLVIWISIHLFAMLVNIAGINNYTWKTVKEIGHNSDFSKVWGCEHVNKKYFLTSCLTKDFLNSTTEFWPFVKFNSYESPQSQSGDLMWCINIFNGIFYKYDYTEFLLYSILPFIIVLLKKLWT